MMPTFATNSRWFSWIGRSYFVTFIYLFINQSINHSNDNSYMHCFISTSPMLSKLMGYLFPRCRNYCQEANVCWNVAALCYFHIRRVPYQKGGKIRCPGSWGGAYSMLCDAWWSLPICIVITCPFSNFSAQVNTFFFSCPTSLLPSFLFEVEFYVYIFLLIFF